MGLNDKIKGSYYRNYEARLASRTSILNIVNDLNDYYTNLVSMINTTYDKITSNRTEMKEKLNSILLKIKTIEYTINNFQLEVDSSIEEKLKKLMENYDKDFVNLVNSYDTNLYNHSKLEDTYSTDNNLYSQSNEEYEKSVEKLNSDMGIRWFGGKLNDRNILSKLKNVIHIVKVNKYEGITNEDYINSNLILDIFIYSTKGITWLTLGQNSNFGYNIRVKYHSLRNKDLNIKIASENYYNVKDYDLNEFDLNMIFDFGYTEDDVKNGNVYIKVKTNVPSNTFSGIEEYYLSNSDNLNQETDKRVIKNIGNRHIGLNNKDYAYNVNQITDLDTFRDNNKKYDDSTDYVPDYISDNYNNTEVISDNNFTLYSEIKSEKGTNNSVNIIKSTVKRSSDNTEISGLNDSIGPIVIDSDDLVKVNLDKSYFNDSDKFINKEDEDQNIPYNKNLSRIDLLDYRNVGDIGLITKNENTFIVNNDLENNNETVVVGKTNNLKDDNIPSVNNDITNNKLLDINFDTSFDELPVMLNSTDSLIDLKPGNSFDDCYNEIIKHQELDDGTNIFLYSNKDLIIVRENVWKYGNKISNINDFVVLKDGTVYLFTTNGIKLISNDNVKSGSFITEATNIINGNFITACLTNDKTRFYTVKTDSSISDIDSTTNKYKLVGLFYIYDPNTTEIKDLGEYCNTYNFSTDIISSETKSDLQDLTNGSDYKLIFWTKYNIWLLLNKTTGKVFTSDIGTFGNFKINNEISSEISKVELLSLDENTNTIYLAKNKNYLETSQTLVESDFTESDQNTLRTEIEEKINTIDNELTASNDYNNDLILTYLASKVTETIKVGDSDTTSIKLDKVDNTYYFAVTISSDNSNLIPIAIYTSTDLDSFTLAYLGVRNSTVSNKSIKYFKISNSSSTIILNTTDTNDTYYFIDILDKETNTSTDLFSHKYDVYNKPDEVDFDYNIIKVPYIYTLDYSQTDSKFTLTKLKKATKSVKNSTNYYERVIVLNTNISDINDIDIEKDVETDIVYLGHEPIRIDNQLYVLSDNFVQIYDMNGYYYIIDIENRCLYKVDYERVVVGKISFNSIIPSTYLFHINWIIAFNKQLCGSVSIDGTDNYYLFADIETIKTYPKLLTKTTNYSTNKYSIIVSK